MVTSLTAAPLPTVDRSFKQSRHRFLPESLRPSTGVQAADQLVLERFWLQKKLEKHQYASLAEAFPLFAHHRGLPPDEYTKFTVPATMRDCDFWKRETEMQEIQWKVAFKLAGKDGGRS